MELTPAVVIIVVVVAVAGFVLIRWASRHEAAAPLDGPVTPVRSNTMAARGNRDASSLVDWLLERASEQTGLSVADDALARQRITEAAAKAMEELETHGSATISLPFLMADARGPKHFDVEIKRSVNSTFEATR